MAADKRSIFRFGPKQNFKDEYNKILKVGPFDLIAAAGLSKPMAVPILRWIPWERLPPYLLPKNLRFFEPMKHFGQWVKKNKEFFETRQPNGNLVAFQQTFENRLGEALHPDDVDNLPKGSVVASLILVSFRGSNFFVSRLDAYNTTPGHFKSEVRPWDPTMQAIGCIGEPAIVEDILAGNSNGWTPQTIDPIKDLLVPNANKSLEDGLRVVGTLIYLSHSYGVKHDGITGVSRTFDAYLLSSTGVQEACINADSMCHITEQKPA